MKAHLAVHWPADVAAGRTLVDVTKDTPFTFSQMKAFWSTTADAVQGPRAAGYVGLCIARLACEPQLFLRICSSALSIPYALAHVASFWFPHFFRLAYSLSLSFVGCGGRWDRTLLHSLPPSHPAIRSKCSHPRSPGLNQPHRCARICRLV